MNRKQKFEIEIVTKTVDGCNNPVKSVTEGAVRRAVEQIEGIIEVNVDERKGGGYNSAKPTSRQLSYWKRLTDENNHALVRKHICKWAFDNAKTNAVKDTVYVTGKVIQGYYEDWSKRGRSVGNEREEACMRMSIVIGAIRAEFGPDTAEIINSCM